MGKFKEISLSYGKFANDYANDQLEFITNIKRHIIDNEDIPNFDKLNETNSITVLFKLISILNLISNTDQFCRLCDDIVSISEKFKSKDIHNENLCKYIDHLNDGIYKLFITKFYLSNDLSILLVKLRSVYEALITMMNYCKYISEPSRSIKIIAIKNPSINESSIMNTTSYKIYSAHSPNGTNIVGKHIAIIDPDCSINPLLDINIDCGEILGKLPKICEYFNSIKNNINDKNSELFKSAINNVYNKLIDNNTGLNLLRDNLKTVYESIRNIECVDYSSYKPINELKCYIESMINTISSRITQNTTSDDINESYDILGEMGLSFIYNFSEDLSGDGEIEAFNEACEKYVPDDLYDDVIQCMTESLADDIKDHISNSLNKYSERSELRREQRMRNKMDREERSEARRNERRDRNESIREERRNRRMQAREERRDRRREQHDRNIDTFIYKNKVIAMTDPNARKMIRLLKSCVAGLVGAGAGTALFGKQSAMLAAALGFLAKYSSSKTSSSMMRSEIANYIQTEIKIMDSKIDELDRIGDSKNKAKLMRLKSRMETTYKAMVHCLPSGELTYLT